MNEGSVMIPALCPYPCQASMSPGGYYASSQPIMQLKDLEVDRVRYDQYKLMLATPKKKQRK